MTRHVGDYLLEVIQSTGNTIQGTAAAIGASRSHLQRIIRGECRITPGMARRLEKCLGVKAKQWLIFQAEHEVSDE